MVGGLLWLLRNIILLFSIRVVHGCSSWTRPSGSAASHIINLISFGSELNWGIRFVNLPVSFERRLEDFEDEGAGRDVVV